MIELAGNVIIKEGKILLLYNREEGFWKLPGGKVEDNESPTETAVRKAEEEIGVETVLKKPFYSGEFSKNSKIYLWHGYLAKIEEGEPQIQDSEVCEKLKWISGEEFGSIDIAPPLKMIEPGLRRILKS